jgi:hypothetical protein
MEYHPIVDRRLAYYTTPDEKESWGEREACRWAGVDHKTMIEDPQAWGNDASHLPHYSTTEVRGK